MKWKKLILASAMITLNLQIFLFIFFIFIKDELVYFPEVQSYAEEATQQKASEQKLTQPREKLSQKLPYKVYEGNTFIRGFATLNQSKKFVSHYPHATAIYRYTEKLWDHSDQYKVYQETDGENILLQHFDQYGDALAFAKDKGNSQITYKDYRLWRNKSNRKRAAYIDDVPMILQYPELPRGCEVTSLAMLLNFAGVEVDKMKLADEVRKDPTPFSKKENVTTFGNPYDGFVGDMYSLDNPGLGVYHGPIRNLAEKYLPGQIVDMTEASFEDILYPVSQGAPVWVIVPSTYDIVPEEQWQTWETPTGTINVTRKMHSVIIVGYDDQYIHVNDPYGRVSQLPRKNFQKGWEQMGRQAITFIPE